ncbi:hypothetical protein ACFV1L_24695 [Kitasatospora sp. NPDC059646]|uniref:hypothetical protein n=1 Tax=Kitasatospora sp. NPDC059646 TaxID=3346893 RepID=UPI00369BF8CD
MSNEASAPPTALHWPPAARVNSLGGPLLVCDARSFPDWGGAGPDPHQDLDPAGDYVRAWTAVHPDDDDLDAATVRFGTERQHTALIWETDGEATAEIALPAHQDGPADTFLLMRSWIPRTWDAPRRRAARARPAEERPAGVLDLPTGRAVIAWAAVAASETRPAADTPTPDARHLALDTDGTSRIGAVLHLAPGTYRVTVGEHEGDRGRYLPAAEHDSPPSAFADNDWSCRWIRFARTGPSPVSTRGRGPA